MHEIYLAKAAITAMGESCSHVPDHGVQRVAETPKMPTNDFPTTNALIDITAFNQAITDNAQYHAGWNKHREKLQTFVSYYESCKHFANPPQYQVSLVQGVSNALAKHQTDPSYSGAELCDVYSEKELDGIAKAAIEIAVDELRCAEGLTAADA